MLEVYERKNIPSKVHFSAYQILYRKAKELHLHIQVLRISQVDV